MCRITHVRWFYFSYTFCFLCSEQWCADFAWLQAHIAWLSVGSASCSEYLSLSPVGSLVLILYSISCLSGLLPLRHLLGFVFSLFVVLSLLLHLLNLHLLTLPSLTEVPFSPGKYRPYSWPCFVPHTWEGRCVTRVCRPEGARAPETHRGLCSCEVEEVAGWRWALFLWVGMFLSCLLWSCL